MQWHIFSIKINNSSCANPNILNETDFPIQNEENKEKEENKRDNKIHSKK